MAMGRSLVFLLFILLVIRLVILLLPAREALSRHVQPTLARLQIIYTAVSELGKLHAILHHGVHA
jgi:hypothetical protein